MSTLKKILLSIKKSHRKLLIYILCGMIVLTIVEMLTIASIIPLLSTIFGNDNLLLEKYFSELITIQLINKDFLIYYTLILIIIVFLFKSILSTFFIWFINKSTATIVLDLASELYEYYLKRQPLITSLNRNSAELMRNIQGSVNSAVNGYLIACLNILLEVMVVLGISSILFYVNPATFISLLIFFTIISATYILLTNSLFLNWGRKVQKYDFKRIKHLKQGLYATKEIRLLGKEDNFISYFFNALSKSVLIGVKLKTISSLPRIWLEFIVISIFSLSIIFMSISGNTINEIMLLLSIYAATSFRLMPGLNKIVGNIQTLKFSVAPVDILYEEILVSRSSYKDLKIDNIKIKNFNKLEIKNMDFEYQNNEKQTLKEINLIINKNDSLGIIGESGSGKSTLINIIMGILDPNKGLISVNDISLIKCKKSYQSLIGFVPQDIFLTDDTIAKNIALGRSDKEINQKKLDYAIEKAQLGDFVLSLPRGKETIIGEFGSRISGGQKQRIGIARALYNEPQILILDESTSSLDAKTEKDIIDNVINEFKDSITMIIISHRHSAIESCDKIVNVIEGKIHSNNKLF